MKELEQYIDSNDRLLITSRTEDGLSIRWRMNKIGFYLYVTKKGEERYKCYGEIFAVGETFEARLLSISKKECSEKDIIMLLGEMIDSSIEIMEFLKNKKDYLSF
jgi:hypothetical protein